MQTQAQDWSRQSDSTRLHSQSVMWYWNQVHPRTRLLRFPVRNDSIITSYQPEL